MIQDRQKLEKFEKFALNEMDKLVGLFMTKDDNNGYVMYDRYHLTPVPKTKLWTVTKNGTKISDFETRRIAGAWCIADHHHRFRLEHEILFYNQEYMKVCNRIDFSRDSLSSDPERRDIQIARMLRDKDYKRHIENALDKLVGSAKYIQLKGFTNETERSSAQSARTKRR